MQKRTLLAALAVATATAIATPNVSYAQDPQPPTPTPTPTPTPMPTPTPQPPTTQESKGEVAMEPNFNSLIAALDSTTAQTVRIKALTSVTPENVQFVNVDELVKDNSVESLNTSIKTHQADVDALRTALGENAAIAELLSKHTTPLTANDVVAADVKSDGKVVVYYWKK